LLLSTAEENGRPFLVLELVEGDTLQERIARGRIPLDDALPVARLIAEALEEAHEHGIVHRDLKPANVKLTPEGKVKVLDFGLAKAYSGDGDTGQSDLSPGNSPVTRGSSELCGCSRSGTARPSPHVRRRGTPSSSSASQVRVEIRFGDQATPNVRRFMTTRSLRAWDLYQLSTRGH
jgi:serine/threonine protein kinase